MQNPADRLTEIAVGRASRRRLFTRLLTASAGLAAVGLVAPAEAKKKRKKRNPDFDILNFALNLEYLEAEFYAYAVTGAGIPASDTEGVGTEGATTGGAQVPFSDSLVRAVAIEIAADELAHVRFLRSVLGSKAVGKPAINLAALGIGFANDAEFLTVARAFEDLGVSAYAGAANQIDNKTILQAAAQILATETYHAGNIRLQVAVKGITVPAVDALDQPPSTANFFPTDGNGLAVIRSVDQVIAVAAPFFPSGLNGRIG